MYVPKTRSDTHRSVITGEAFEIIGEARCLAERRFRPAMPAQRNVMPGKTPSGFQVKT
jgi:hypothetical protein